MARNLRLRTAQDFREITNTNFLISQEIEQPKTRRVTEGLKEPGQIEWSFAGHALRIRLDECDCKAYIHLDEYV